MKNTEQTYMKNAGSNMKFSELKIDDIQCIGYHNGSFFISQYLWNDFAHVMRTNSVKLFWLAAPPWFYDDEHKRMYNLLNERYQLSSFHDGEWMNLTKEKEILSETL